MLRASQCGHVLLHVAVGTFIKTLASASMCRCCSKSCTMPVLPLPVSTQHWWDAVPMAMSLVGLINRKSKGRLVCLCERTRYWQGVLCKGWRLVGQGVLWEQHRSIAPMTEQSMEQPRKHICVRRVSIIFLTSKTFTFTQNTGSWEKTYPKRDSI